MENLPSLRFIAKPDWGLGIDARLRFGFGFNCFMVAESYLSGKSIIGFGLEPRKAPWLRVQITPAVKLIARVPLVRISKYKFAYVGAEGTLFDKGAHPKPEMASVNAFWKSIRHFVLPSFEVRHHNTLLGTLFDERQRRLLKDALREVSKRRAADRGRIQANRDRIMKTFDPPELPPLDPRRGASDSRMQIHEEIKRRQLRKPTDYPALLDDLRERGIKLPDGLGSGLSSRNEARMGISIQCRTDQGRYKLLLGEYPMQVSSKRT